MGHQAKIGRPAEWVDVDANILERPQSVGLSDDGLI